MAASDVNGWQEDDDHQCIEGPGFLVEIEVMLEVDCTSNDGEVIARVIRGIKTFPITLTIYDRTMSLANRDEALVLSYGLEIGYFVAQDKREL